MGWLRSLFAQSEIIARLTFERDFYSTRLIELEGKLKASEVRLRTEINSNRRREDALKSEIVTLAGARPNLPYREEIEEETREMGLIDLGAGPPVAPNEVFERLIASRVEEFAEQAAERGAIYTPEDREVLADKIRQNPDEFSVFL